MANLWVIFPESIHGLGKDPPFPALSFDGFTGRGRIFADFYNAPADDFSGDGELNLFPSPPFVEFFCPQKEIAWLIYG
jgi:hypothetical protein